MNLMYIEFNTGCYVGYNESTGMMSYDYGSTSNLGCYYADLEPNTTYTIQRVDDSTRFRIGISNTDYKFLSASSYTSISSAWTQSFMIDSSEPLTFTTGDSDIYLVAYYTNASEFATRVMLNEGDTILEYKPPTKEFKPYNWRIDDGYPYQKTLGSLIKTPTEPYPVGVMCIDDGYPYFSSLNLIDPISEPYPVGVMSQKYGSYPSFAGHKLIDVGAFANATVLREVHIPKSVIHIGKTAFRNTSIAEVTINSQCKYYPTSFPDFCKINFYPD